jgi:hypothetical protein
MGNLYDFLLKLETSNLLIEGIKSGAISSNHKTWYEMAKEYKSKLSKRPGQSSEILHELSIKYGLSWNRCYQIIKKF